MESNSDSNSSIEVVDFRNIETQNREENKIADHPIDVSDNSSDITSSSDASAPRLDFPVLFAIESPKLSGVVTALNSTVTFNSLFSNNGIDIISEIPYDPEWYRKMLAPIERSEASESEWIRSVRVEFQLLNAFLNGSFARLTASTGNLESLFRMKMSRLEEPQLRVSTIFKFFATIDQFSDQLMQFVDIDSEHVPVLPIPVDVEDYKGSLQGALDRVFWPHIMNYSESSEEYFQQIPVFERLCDVLAIQCQQMDIILDEYIWPERYTAEYKPIILKKWVESNRYEDQLKDLNTRLQKFYFMDGEKPVIEALDVSIDSLAKAGQESAATELSQQLNKLKSDISSTLEEIRNVKDAKEKHATTSEPLVPIDSTKMTPYQLKSILWPDFSTENALTISKSMDSPEEWLYSHGPSCRTMSWTHVVQFAKRSQNYIAFYEKKHEAYSYKLAPSVLEFASKVVNSQTTTDTISSPSSPSNDDDHYNHGIQHKSSTVIPEA